LRVVVLAEWAVGAQEADVFFEQPVEQQDFAKGLSLREEKQMFRVKRGALEAPAKLELSVEAQKGVVWLMIEVKRSRALEAGTVVPVPVIPFRSR
jgi:hypothetical protein